MFEKELEQIFVDFWKYKPKYIFRKQFEPYFKSEQPMAIIGPRRAGKSYCLYQIRDYLITKNKLNANDFLYINFENLKLTGFTYKNFDEILKVYNSIYPDKKPILMLDEIQNINLWYKYARDLADKKYLVYITGSNSKMISKEIATHLGARYIKLIVYPFSFDEYLEFKGIFSDKESILLNKDKIVNNFKLFFDFGGYPEIIDQDIILKKESLKIYFDLVIGDIVKRWNVRDENSLELLIKKIKENITKETTIKNYIKFFKSIDYIVDERDVYKYFKYLIDSFFVFPVELQKKSLKAKNYLKKYYFSDNGFISLFEVEKDEGLKLENLVFVECLKKGFEINYFKETKECDFVLKKDNKVNQIIQVTYQLDKSDTREIPGLLAALDYYNLDTGLILTYNQEETIKQDKKTIHVLPVWKWLLQTKK
jgi:hypothetical protein